MKPNPSLSNDHLSAVRMLGYTLKLGMRSDNLVRLAYVWQVRLTAPERAGLLGAAIWAAEPHDALNVIDAIAPRVSGPLPAFADLDAEAADWAALASLPELRAYLVPIYRHLPERDRREFAAAITGRAAA